MKATLDLKNNSRDPLNREILESLKELASPENPSPLGELIDLFMVDADQREEQLKQAYRDRDIYSLKEVTHILKGSAGNLGADYLATQCARADKLISLEKNFSPELDQLCLEIAQEFASVRDALQEERLKEMAG